MAIELVFVHPENSEFDDESIQNAPCVPQVGTTIDTNQGARRIKEIRHDFHATNGNLRAHLYLARL